MLELIGVSEVMKFYPLFFIDEEPECPGEFSDLCKILQLLVAGLGNLNLLLPNAAVYFL